MASVKPMLGDIELELVQRIEIDDDQLLAQHSVPALEGDFLQGLGRRASRVSLSGVMTGPKAGESLKTLRDKFRAGEPTTFVADIATATKVGTVLIEEMKVRELAGKPERFEYELTLREQLPPPKPVVEEPPPPPPEPPPPPPPIDKGKLIVEVLVKDQPEFDSFDKVVVSIEGAKQEDGSTLTRTLTNREGNKWTDEDVPPGKYKVNAVEANPLSMTDEVNVNVTGGQAANKTVTLSSTAIIARAFIVHFRFNSAFLEPCMRAVLQDVEKFANAPANKDLKMLIVGHTDKTGSRKYNQALSERRARAVFAYLTFLNDSEASIREWNNLRKKQKPGAVTTINDSWDVREYQQILQDLGFYPGNIDGNHGPKTDEAVRAFRCKNGLPPGTKVDDQTWTKLIDEYMSQDFIGIDNERFLPNGSGILKWLGCGEDAPLPLPKPTRDTAFRPYRRVEVLFVNAKELPCKVPEPDTYKLPEDGPKEPDWALGPGDPDKRQCFGSRECDKVKPPEWCIRPDDETTITVKGSITNEDGTAFTDKEGKKYVIITADGEFIHISKDGKVSKEGEQFDGNPKVSRTGKDATFAIPDKRVGVYTLEVHEDVIIRLKEQQDKNAKGNIVCKRLKAASDELNVVVVNAPVLRQITLPVAVHLMRGLQAKTRELRTCKVGPAVADPLPQETSFLKADNKDVRDLFDKVNKIWKQARISFNVVNIVREVFTHPVINECNVDDIEFEFLLKDSGYPSAVNVFIFGHIAGNFDSDAGFGISEEKAAGLGIGLKLGGCAIGDIVSGIPLNADQKAVALAHTLGHYLTLEHADENVAANSKRLMLPGTVSDLDRKIVETKKEPEVSKARASKGARLDCLPLKLEVTDAFRIGGSLSHVFMAIPSVTEVTKIDAVISDELLAVGTLAMTGGEPGANDRQRIIDRAILNVPPPETIEATYTPNGGGEVLTARVIMHVDTLRVRVEGATRSLLDSDKFIASPHPTDVVLLRTPFDSLQSPQNRFCVPIDFVKWEGGIEMPDPLRRTVSRAKAGTFKVKASALGEERTRTIEIREVLLTNNIPPFNGDIDTVEIIGLLNSQLFNPTPTNKKRLTQANLFQGQTDRFFRARADVAGAGAGPIQATLNRVGPDNSVVESITLTLTKTTGDRFVSEPILAIPAVLTDAELNVLDFQDFKVIRAKAGDKLRLQRAAKLTVPEDASEATVRGRVVHIFAQSFKNSGTDEATIKKQIKQANRIWSQAGVEVKERGAKADVTGFDNLLDLDTFSGRKPFPGTLTPEETVLLNIPAVGPDGNPIFPGGPPRSQAALSDLNIYYIRSYVDPTLPQVTVGGITYTTESFSPMTDPGQSGISIKGTGMTANVLAHEMGHAILINWPGQEHQDQSSPPQDWPSNFVMHPQDTNDSIDVDQLQVENILTSTGNGTNPFVVFEP